MTETQTYSHSCYCFPEYVTSERHSYLGVPFPQKASIELYQESKPNKIRKCQYLIFSSCLFYSQGGTLVSSNKHTTNQASPFSSQNKRKVEVRDEALTVPPKDGEYFSGFCCVMLLIAQITLKKSEGSINPNLSSFINRFIHSINIYWTLTMCKAF